MVFGVYPILRSIGYGMGKREAVFVVWGGLHGAVGLALAMNVQAQLNSDRRTGDLVLFHVAAVSFLSMIINGTTARYVLQALGLVKTPGARLKLRARVREAIEAKAADAHQTVWKSTSASGTRCRVDGVEIDAAIQGERAVN